MDISATLNPDYLQTVLRRLLRRDSVDRIVLALKWTLTALATGIVTATVVQLINSHLAVRAETIKLKNDISALAATDRSQTQEQKANISVITQKNVFGSLGPKASSSSAAPVKPATKLPLTLIGTFLEKGDEPYAIIEDDKKKVQDVFNIDDMVFGDAKLVAVHSDRVEINRHGQVEVLKLDDAPDVRSGPTSGSGGGGEDIVVDEKELTQALDNLPLLLTQARAVPYFKDGKAIGLRMFSIKSGSLYEKVGLQNGDILKSINGNSLSDISQAMKLFETLKAERSISVSLERNREEKEYKYQIR